MSHIPGGWLYEVDDKEYFVFVIKLNLWKISDMNYRSRTYSTIGIRELELVKKHIHLQIN